MTILHSTIKTNNVLLYALSGFFWFCLLYTSVAQFQSLLLPFIVIFTIPLAFSGGLLTLVICGMEVSVIAMIGLLLLAGIIVNNGIVYVDCVNQLRLDGMEKHEAMIEAGRRRLRPILKMCIRDSYTIIHLDDN